MSSTPNLDELAAEVATTTRKRGRPRKDTSPTSAPRKPKSTAGRPTPLKSPTGTVGRPTNDARVQQSIERLLTMYVGMPLALVNRKDAETVIEAAPALAESIMQLARKYPSLYRFLLDSGEHTVWLNFASVTILGVALPIAANHWSLKLPPFMLDAINSARIAAIAPNAAPIEPAPADPAPTPEESTDAV